MASPFESYADHNQTSRPTPGNNPKHSGKPIFFLMNLLIIFIVE
jgi:hypothetical protein